MKVEDVPGGETDKDNKDYRVNLLSFHERYAAESCPENADSWPGLVAMISTFSEMLAFMCGPDAIQYLAICRDRYYKAMLGRLPYKTSAQLLFWGVCNQSYAKTLAIRCVSL